MPYSRASKTARMKNDPEYRARQYRFQNESRKRKRERDLLLEDPPCPHVASDGQKCWRVEPHQHREP